MQPSGWIRRAFDPVAYSARATRFFYLYLVAKAAQTKGVVQLVSKNSWAHNRGMPHVMKRLADHFGLSEELFGEMEIELHENYGSSGDMLYGFYFVVPDHVPEKVSEATGWQPGQTIDVPLHVMETDIDDELWEEVDDEEWAWIQRNPQEERFLELSMDLSYLQDRSNSHNIVTNQLDYRILYAYGVTLFEAFLTETAKHLIANDARALRNAATFFAKEKTTKRFTISEVLDLDPSKYILGLVSGLLFHNTQLAGRFFSALLDQRIDFSSLDKIVKQRHDIIHRNGKTREGKDIRLTSEEVKAALTEIEGCAEKLHNVVLKAEGNTRS